MSIVMNKEQFRALFLDKVSQILAKAQSRIGVPIASNFDIELHGGGIPGKKVPLDQALDTMYINEALFFPIIDIGVKAVTRGTPLIFVRISDFPPSPFSKTWNTPPGSGPFKEIEFMSVKIDP
jgi:hypothetical protein